jgi:hypothetical protein
VETRQKWDKSGLDMTDLLSVTARDPQLSLAFKYASLLLNNSYFLEGLVSDRPSWIPFEAITAPSPGIMHHASCTVNHLYPLMPLESTGLRHLNIIIQGVTLNLPTGLDVKYQY